MAFSITPFTIACLLVFISSFASAIFIFFSRPISALKTLWGLISMIVAVVNLGLFFMMTSTSYEVAYQNAFILNFITIFIPAMFFHFTSILTNTHQRKDIEIKIYYSLTIIYMALVMFYPHYFLRGVGPLFELHYYAQSGPLYYFLPLLFVYLIDYGLVVVYLNFRSATAVKKNQLKYFFIGCCFGVVGGISAFLPVLDIPVHPWGLCLLPIYVWIVSYAIVKHQLMDIKFVLRKSLVYTSVISLLTVLFFIFVYFAEKTFHQIVGYRAGMNSIFAMACITLLAAPIYRLFQSIVDRYFYKGTVSQIAQENRRLHDELLVLESNRVLREVARMLVLETQEPLKRISLEAQFNPILKEDVNYIQRVIADLWEYSETVPKNYVEVDIIALLDQKIDKIAVNHTNNTIFKYYQSFKSIKIFASEEQLGRCFENILTYCSKAIYSGGEIFIAIEYNKQWVSLSIRHNAYSLSNYEIENFFKPFFRSEKLSNGISLALAKAIILQHGGKIQLDIQEKEAVDFLIDLPIN